MNVAEAPLAGLRVRRASRADLPRLLELIADDMLGKNREGVGSDDPVYEHAFEAIDRDANQYLMLAALDGRVVGMLQLTFIPYLTHRGSWRMLIEGVRVAGSVRGQGLGHEMFEWAIAACR